jgi:hypothetical protein
MGEISCNEKAEEQQQYNGRKRARPSEESDRERQRSNPNERAASAAKRELARRTPAPDLSPQRSRA